MSQVAGLGGAATTSEDGHWSRGRSAMISSARREVSGSPSVEAKKAGGQIGGVGSSAGLERTGLVRAGKAFMGSA